VSHLTDQRARILDLLNRQPGLHFAALARQLDLATGQAQYHLKRLRRAGRLVTHEHDGRTHYFPPDVDPAERRIVATLRRETARDIVATLVEDGPSRPNAVADRVGIARSTLEWHCDRLMEADLLRKEREERGRVTLALTDERDAVHWLLVVDPSATDRLVDRFTRLVDGLLDG
jgi:predicted transcriptional regulator